MTLKHRFVLFMLAVSTPLPLLSSDEGPVEELCHAAKRGNLAVVKKYKAEGVDINTPGSIGWTPLMFAAYEGHIDVVQYLVDRGANVNYTPSYDHETALHWAASQDRVEVVKYLLSKGADVKRGDEGYPLLLLASGRNPRIAEAFIALGANVNGCDTSGSCVLICACEREGLDIVPLLIGHGANVNIQGSGCAKSGLRLKKVSPLIIATQHGNLELIKYLIRNGARLNLRDAKGKTALKYAQESMESPVLEYLVSLGAK